MNASIQVALKFLALGYRPWQYFVAPETISSSRPSLEQKRTAPRRETTGGIDAVSPPLPDGTAGALDASDANEKDDETSRRGSFADGVANATAAIEAGAANVMEAISRVQKESPSLVNVRRRNQAEFLEEMTMFRSQQQTPTARPRVKLWSRLNGWNCLDFAHLIAIHILNR